MKPLFALDLCLFPCCVGDMDIWGLAKAYGELPQ
jgi:hypothetical protein